MRDTIISNKAMKTKTIIWISAPFILLVASLVTANFSAPVDASKDPGAASLFIQITPTLIPEGLSEIGSTDGILIMGVVIALIAMVPVIISRNRK
jgi:hypothetical protein